MSWYLTLISIKLLFKLIFMSCPCTYLYFLRVISMPKWMSFGYIVKIILIELKQEQTRLVPVKLTRMLWNYRQWTQYEANNSISVLLLKKVENWMLCKVQLDDLSWRLFTPITQTIQSTQHEKCFNLDIWGKWNMKTWLTVTLSIHLMENLVDFLKCLGPCVLQRSYIRLAQTF